MNLHGIQRKAGQAALLCGALLLLCALRVTPALGQAGTLDVQQGEVKLRHDGRSQVLKAPAQGVAVFVGDALHSGPESMSQLHLTAGQDVVALYGNSYFTVQSASEDDTRLSLGIGKALFRVFARLKSTARFEVKTATAVVGVKGTEFVVGTDGETTYVLTILGVVNLVTEALAAREVLVLQDTVSAARRAEPPVPPQPVTPDVRDRVVKEQGIGTFKSLDLRGGKEEKKDARKESAAKVGETQQVLKERTQDAPPPPRAGSLRFGIDLSLP